MRTIRTTGLLPILFVVVSCGRCGDDGPVDDSVAHSESDSGGDDADRDGFPAGQDCDDANPQVYPGAAEVCDGLDNDCNESVDDVVQQADLCDGVDNDCDGFFDEDEILVFESDGGSTFDWSASVLDATASEPVQLSLAEAGELRVCGGDRRFLLLDISASVAVKSANPAIDVEISGGEALATVINITGDSAVAVALENVTIRDGVGDGEVPGLGGTVGGGVLCVGGASVEFRDVVLTLNSAGERTSRGGGLFVHGCAVSMVATNVTDNYSDVGGGGVFVYGGTLEITDSSFVSNESALSGGGAAIGTSSFWDGTSDVPVDVVMENSIVKDNLSGYAVTIEGKSSFECIGDASGEYGIVRNLSERGAVYMQYDSYGFTGTNCDMGSAADGNDNSGPDVYGDDDVAWTADIGNDATFFCSIAQGGCTIE